MKPDSKKRLMTIPLVWAGCFIVFMFVYTLFLAPQRRLARQFASQIEEQKKVYADALDTADSKKRAKFAKEVELLKEKLESFAIDSDDSASLIFDIGQIANHKDIEAFSITSQKGGKATIVPNCKYIQESLISISFDGGFSQFAMFLNDLERHSPVVFIDGFAITRARNDKPVHRATMKLAVFAVKRNG